MRVIAGTAGGIPLSCPRWDGVRPTMDQVRAAVFSSLAERVPGARVLDLFAGTGGLGIEALSRGALSATFVERDRRAADCIRKNLASTRLADGAEVICLDAATYLQRKFAEDTASEPCDLIFADPPYTTQDQREDFATQLLTSPFLVRAMDRHGMFVLEKSPRHPVDLEVNGWTPVRQKRYGTTEVVFLKRSESVEASEHHLVLSASEF